MSGLFVKREDVVHDGLRGDAFVKNSFRFFGLYELLRILPDLRSVSPKREPQADQVRLHPSAHSL